MRIVDVQEEEDDKESDSGNREIQIPDPSPGSKLRQNATKYWPESSCACPNKFESAQEQGTPSRNR